MNDTCKSVNSKWIMHWDTITRDTRMIYTVSGKWMHSYFLKTFHINDYLTFSTYGYIKFSTHINDAILFVIGMNGAGQSTIQDHWRSIIALWLVTLTKLFGQFEEERWEILKPVCFRWLFQEFTAAKSSMLTKATWSNTLLPFECWWYIESDILTPNLMLKDKIVSGFFLAFKLVVGKLTTEH